MVVTLTTSQNPRKATLVGGGCRVTSAQPPFPVMLLIGFTGPSSLLNRLFFIGFITPAKEGGTLMSKKSLYKTIPGRVTAHSTWCNPIQSCLARNLRSFHLLLPPRLLLQTRIKIVYLYVYYLVYNSFSPPYLLSFQVTI